MEDKHIYSSSLWVRFRDKVITLKKEYFESFEFLSDFTKKISSSFQNINKRKNPPEKKKKKPAIVKEVGKTPVVVRKQKPVKSTIAKKTIKVPVSRELDSKILTFVLIASIIIIMLVGIILSSIHTNPIK